MDTAASLLPATRLDGNGMVVEQTADGEWTYDPNEPRYCICNQVSYGDMVACDNDVVSRAGGEVLPLLVMFTYVCVV